MANPVKSQDSLSPNVLERIRSLETRLDRIESRLSHLSPADTVEFENTHSNENPEYNVDSERPAGLQSFQESSVFEYGFVWISAIVYLFGIVFLTVFTRDLGYRYLPSVIGYTAVIFVFSLSFFLKKAFPHLLLPLQIIGFILLYYVTLTLHFFIVNPVLQPKVPALMLLLSINVILFIYAYKKESEFLTILAVASTLATALFYNYIYISLSLYSISVLVSLFFLSRAGWWRLTVITLVLVYLSHLIWLLNNPLLGNELKAIEIHHSNLLYLYFYFVAYTFTAIYPRQKPLTDSTLFSISVINALCFSFLLWLITIIYYQNNFTWIYLLLAVFCLVFAARINTAAGSKFLPAFYACVGFMALSVAVYGISGMEHVYFYLSLESFLVVSIALWFRSKIIVLVNTILFVSLMLTYLVSADSINYITFTFAFTALGTARILNWKKERLTLKTDLLRNIYLIAAFFMVLIGLSHLAGEKFITLAWTGAAVLYFIVSIILKNKKYRWMSVLTLLVSGIRLFLIDLSRMEVGYRVVAFLLFAVIALSVSLIYSKRIKGKI